MTSKYGNQCSKGLPTTIYFSTVPSHRNGRQGCIHSLYSNIYKVSSLLQGFCKILYSEKYFNNDSTNCKLVEEVVNSTHKSTLISDSHGCTRFTPVMTLHFQPLLPSLSVDICLNTLGSLVKCSLSVDICLITSALSINCLLLSGLCSFHKSTPPISVASCLPC